MSRSAKDSAEVVEFMTLFARLKHWSDDAPEELADLAATDTSAKDLCIQLSFAARFIKMNERRAQALFAAPVDPLSANLTETPAPLGITVGRWR